MVFRAFRISVFSLNLNTFSKTFLGSVKSISSNIPLAGTMLAFCPHQRLIFAKSRNTDQRTPLDLVSRTPCSISMDNPQKVHLLQYPCKHTFTNFDARREICNNWDRTFQPVSPPDDTQVSVRDHRISPAFMTCSKCSVLK